MRALLAFDKFKDSLTAPEACAAAAAALRQHRPEWTLDSCPLADGGEGFADILTRAVGGERRELEVTGPRGVRVLAHYGLVPAGQVPVAARAVLGGDETATIAVIEMAAASGLALLDPHDRDAWQTASTGTGELIRAAVDAGADMIVLGVGGSATHDLGFGALRALGLAFHDATGASVVNPRPATWAHLARITGHLSLPPVHIACDVTNPLLGPSGAAAVYGPQKGLRADDVARLDDASERMALLLSSACGVTQPPLRVPGAGAAGGIAFGFMVAANARLVSGFDLVSRWLALEPRIAAADVVLTGEGRFDDSSLSGKGPGAVAARALELGKPVHVFAGAVTAPRKLPGLALHPITPAGTPLSQALRDAGPNMERAVAAAFAPARGGNGAGR